MTTKNGEHKNGKKSWLQRQLASLKNWWLIIFSAIGGAVLLAGIAAMTVGPTAPRICLYVVGMAMILFAIAVVFFRDRPR